MNQLQKLLKQWAQLEPEICKKSIVNPGSFRVCSFLVDPNVNSNVLPAFVQQATQRAISSKPDWDMLLELDRHPADGKPVWIAAVFRPGDVEGSRSSSDEAAIALLEAYLKALAAGDQTSAEKEEAV